MRRSVIPHVILTKGALYGNVVLLVLLSSAILCEELCSIAVLAPGELRAKASRRTSRRGHVRERHADIGSLSSPAGAKDDPG